MAVAMFDTLKFANTLKTAGVPDKQAEAQAVAFAEIIQLNIKDLATKDDLVQLKTELSAKIDTSVAKIQTELSAKIDTANTKVQAELSAKIDTAITKVQSEQVLIRWMMGVGLLGTLSIIIRLFLFRGAQ